ncbi:hypothetical protein K7432_014364 [Basidiobolus ranarum]|uniref:Uncharacterized protein n=1 Tax=Basidiobolus ranarum TaxID=34480 RepID=A0ABR2WHQ7_9FUNG
MGCAHSQYELYRIIGTNDSPSTSWSEGSYYVQGDVKATSWGVPANADKIVSVVGPTFTEKGEFLPKLLADAVPVRVDLLGAARMMRTSLRNTEDFPPIPAGEPKILVLKWLYIVWVPALLVTCIAGLFLRKCSTPIERECLSSVIASSIIPGRQDCTTGKGRQLRVRYAKLSGVDHLALTVGGSVVGIVEHVNADLSASTTIKALQGLPAQFNSGIKARAAEEKNLVCLHWHNVCDCNHKIQKDLCRDEGIVAPAAGRITNMKGLLHRATKVDMNK